MKYTVLATVGILGWHSGERQQTSAEQTRLFFSRRVQASTSMSSGALIRAAFFTAGAVVGGGIAAALGSKKQAQSAPTLPGTVPLPTTATPSPVSAPLSAPSNLPVLEAGVKGILGYRAFWQRRLLQC